MVGPLRETPPFAPYKYSPRQPPPKVLFMDTIKGKTEHSGQLEYLSGGEGGGFPKGADIVGFPLPPPRLPPTFCHGFRSKYLIKPNPPLGRK